MGRGGPLRRVAVVGQSGAGKTTTARAVAARLGLPHVELDALFHGPGWTPRPSFVDDVDRATRGERWVVDGNYAAVRDVVWTRADTVVWLDLPRTTTTRRALGRTLRRVAARTVLWNGNRERVTTMLRATHPVRWSWETHGRHRAELEERLGDPRWAHLRAVRLRTPAEVRSWLTALGQDEPDSHSGSGHPR